MLSLILGVVWAAGGAAMFGERLQLLNFIALLITFGIGSELHLGAVALCSYTMTVGYGSLLFADDQALRSFGRLAIAGGIAFIIAALLFLPSLLHLLGLHAAGRRSGPAARARHQRQVASAHARRK